MRVISPAMRSKAASLPVVALITLAATLICWLFRKTTKTGTASTCVMLNAAFLGIALLSWVSGRLPKLRRLLGGDGGLPWVHAADEMQASEPTVRPPRPKSSSNSRRYLSMIDDDVTIDQHSGNGDHLPPVSVAEAQPANDARAPLTIIGFEKVMKQACQEPCGKQQSGSMVGENPEQPLVGDALHPIIEDPDGPEPKLSSRAPVSVRSSVRSNRSESSQRIIDDLQEQIRKLQEEKEKKTRTPTSARSESSQHIISDLQDQIRRLQEDKSKQLGTPSSARSESSQHIIDGLQEQIRRLQEDKVKQPRTPTSARSESSQRIISELQEEIKHLQSGKTKHAASPSSARSESSQRIIEELQEKLRRLQEEAGAQASNLSSARSESSQRIIRSLQEQIQSLQEGTGMGDQNPATCRSTASDSSQARIEELRAQLQSLKQDASQKPGTDASQQAIAELGAALQRMNAERDDVPETPRSLKSNSSLRSVRSESSQRIIDAMDSELQRAKQEKEALEQKLELQSESSARLFAESQKQMVQLHDQELQLHSQQLTNEQQSQRLADQDNKIEELTKMFHAMSKNMPQHVQGN